jgi:Arc/MetJ-type ribon-helix-helix transcriptional regulator
MTRQVAVKLPDSLADELDRLVESGDFNSRSQVLRAGLETTIATREHEQLRERYRKAMERHPETTSQEIAEPDPLRLGEVRSERS